MTPDELERLMETMKRTAEQWRAEEAQLVWQERPEVLETRKTMNAVQERLQQLLEHNRQKLKASERLLRWQREQFRQQRASRRPPRREII